MSSFRYGEQKSYLQPYIDKFKQENYMSKYLFIGKEENPAQSTVSINSIETPIHFDDAFHKEEIKEADEELLPTFDAFNEIKEQLNKERSDNDKLIQDKEVKKLKVLAIVSKYAYQKSRYGFTSI